MGNIEKAKGDVKVDKQTLSTLYSVIDETRALFHRMRAAAEELHGQGELSGGRRGVLRDLDRLGPQTVPQMARSRPVSRQHIQGIVNQLAEEGYVEFIENPAHKRSHLVTLTEKGKELVSAMNHREEKILTQLEINISESDMKIAANVLRSLRELFESSQWKRLIKGVNKK